MLNPLRENNNIVKPKLQEKNGVTIKTTYETNELIKKKFSSFQIQPALVEMAKFGVPSKGQEIMNTNTIYRQVVKSKIQAMLICYIKLFVNFSLVCGCLNASKYKKLKGFKVMGGGKSGE